MCRSNTQVLEDCYLFDTPEKCDLHIHYKTGEKDKIKLDNVEVIPLTDEELSDIENIDPSIGLGNADSLDDDQRGRLTDRFLEDAENKLDSMMNGG